MKKYLLVLSFLGCFLFLSGLNAREPGWEGGVIRTGADREKIRNTHILHRPYRPLHVYGNTVRRLHYRGTVLPTRGIRRGR